MNVVIVEDELLSAHRLVTLLQEYDSSIQVMEILASIAEAVEWFKTQLLTSLPDLIFMDIHLEDGSAFGLIQQVQLRIPVIFTTAYDRYALRAFKTNSIDYLLKPIDERELAAAIDKFKWIQSKQPIHQSDSSRESALLNWPELAGQPSYKERFMVSVGTKIKSFSVSQIAYFFYEERTTYLMTQDEQTAVVDYSLDKVTSLLNPQHFFRVNRAFLVSLSAIELVHAHLSNKLKLILHPSPRHEVFVSPDRQNDFKKWLGKD